MAAISTVPTTLEELRAFAVARSLFAPTTLTQAIDRLGFVQADPIRAPARAQDLTLRHRVKNYRTGDLERRYATLPVEEDVFINYGFVSRRVHALMHPRPTPSNWPGLRRRQAQAVIEFVRERGVVHPREVDERFAHGTVTNYWGGSSNATTHLLDAMHYSGLVRVVRRTRGIRVYAAQSLDAREHDAASRRRHVDALVDVVVGLYAPVPASSLNVVVNRLRYAAPQWQRELKSAIVRARQRLSRTRVGDMDWFWPAGERATGASVDEVVRLLTPFDPVVWDRRRFELLWGWAYRFEAYTPVPKRKLGYYALPLLWRDRVIGWANVAVNGQALRSEFGYVAGRPPRDRAFRGALDEELDRMRRFLDPAETGVASPRRG